MFGAASISQEGEGRGGRGRRRRRDGEGMGRVEEESKRVGGGGVDMWHRLQPREAMCSLEASIGNFCQLHRRLSSLLARFRVTLTNNPLLLCLAHGLFLREVVLVGKVSNDGVGFPLTQRGERSCRSSNGGLRPLRQLLIFI